MRMNKNNFKDILMDFNIPTHRDIVDLSRPIIVSMESFSDLRNAAPVSDDGTIWDIDFMYLDKTSRNTNVYLADDTRRSFDESDFVQENLRNRTWYGENEHPPSESSLSRFLFIEPTRYAWCILSHEFRGDKYSGRVGLCAPLGTGIILPNIKKFGSNYASSCRIYTPNFIEKEQNGKKILIKKYRMYPVTYDLVATPGYPDCRVASPVDYHPKSFGKESFGNNVVKFENPANELLKMMSSENCKILEDYCHVNFKKQAVLMQNNRVKFSSDDGVSIIATLDRYLISEALKK
jgi:hypothetical protein